MPDKGRQGKCVVCRVRFRWLYPPALSAAHCTICGGKLARTTYISAWPLRMTKPLGPLGGAARRVARDAERRGRRPTLH